jgi:hypothetical protein
MRHLKSYPKLGVSPLLPTRVRASWQLLITLRYLQNAKKQETEQTDSQRRDDEKLDTNYAKHKLRRWPASSSQTEITNLPNANVEKTSSDEQP